MECRSGVALLLLLHITQDLLDTGVYSMKSSCDGQNYYRWYPHKGSTSDWRCCRKCPAGYKVLHQCMAEKPNSTICIPCPNGQFQSVANKNEFCRQCTNKQFKAHRTLLSNCTKTRDLKYGDCEPGFYYNTVLDFCDKCRTCPPGFGVEKDCTTKKNTKCSVKKCSLGKFSDRDSHIQRCENCKSCGVGEEMFQECTATTNYGCKPEGISPSKSVLVTRGTRLSSLTKFQSTSTSDVKADAKSSEGNRQWVMPFFVSAMVLLLVMFLAFVIGVTVWCHRHVSKKRDQEGMVQQMPMIEPSKSKFQDEETRVAALSKLKPERYQLVEVPGKVRESDMLLRDVSHDIIEELASYLNPTNTNNWKKVATRLGYPWDLIKNLELNPTTATQTLLERWGTKRDSRVYSLYVVLKEIDRDDAADVLERVLLGSCPSSTRSV